MGRSTERGVPTQDHLSRPLLGLERQVFPVILAALYELCEEQQLLDLREAFIDGTFGATKRGRGRRPRQKRQRHQDHDHGGRERRAARGSHV